MLLPILPVGKSSYILNNTGRSLKESYGNFKTHSFDCVSFRAQASIYRFSQVDETLYRGGRPEPEQMAELKDVGISTIIDLSTERFRREGYTEADAAAALGINHIKIPVVSGENPSEDDINKFFEIIQGVKEKQGKAYVHCLEGKDRTGLFVELYKIKYGLSDAEKSINTLIKNRYNFSENPLAISFIREFAQKVRAKV